MPPVLQRFQYSVSSTHGKLALAATAKARPTSTATFWPLQAMPMPMDMAPTMTVATRAANTWPRAETSCPARNTPTYRSCAMADADASTRPATTATMVAKATADTKASMKLPKKEFGPPPMYCASRGPARLPPASTAAMLAGPTFFAAPNPKNSVNT